MTGYVPIRNSAGEVVGVLGVDFDISTAKQKQDFLESLIYYVLGAAIIIASLIVLYFGGTLVRERSKGTQQEDQNRAGALSRQPQHDAVDDRAQGDAADNQVQGEIRKLNEALQSVLAAVSFLREHAEKSKAAKKTPTKGSAKPAKRR